MVCNAVRDFFCRAILSEILSEISVRVDQVHDDSVVHLGGGGGGEGGEGGEGGGNYNPFL